MKNVTAIMLSREPLSNKAKARVPAGTQVLNFVSEFKSFKSYQRSWFMAVERVSTEWFFFLDADDELPPGFDKLLERLVSVGGAAALVYTNEVLINDAGIRTLLRKEPYSEEAHVRQPTLCHHLVLGRTQIAQRVIPQLPRGNFMPEPMVYFQMAKAGAVWVDEVGYHWHRGAHGVSYWPSALAAQVASSRWCNEQRAPVEPQVEEPVKRKGSKKAKEA